MAVTAPLTYDGYWLLPCPGCGQKTFCACYPPPVRTYQQAVVRVLPREGETLHDMATDRGRLEWPSR